MLQYKGTRQPPRKYTISDAQLAAIPPLHACDTCMKRAWTSDLFSTLARAPREQTSISVTYEVASERLRSSVLSGCGFCRTIADGIHGRVFLDDLYSRFGATGSVCDDSAPSDVPRDNEIGDSSDECEIDQDDWNDATAFNEEEIEDDETGGWDTWTDRDTLLEGCIFKVDLKFERGEDDLFSFMNAHVEAVDQPPDSDNVLQGLRGEKAVDLRYHVNSTSMQPTDKARIFPIMASTSVLGAEINMNTIEKWMNNLAPLSTALSLDADQLPARLIELQEHGGLCLVNTKHLQQLDKGFAALSYVWGAGQSFILLSTTQASLTQGFEEQQLPKTIQDAISVTRRIGLRYIWVDALCIMQDSDTDKARELPKMRLIYKTACVTIVASVAQAATTGFLRHIDSNPAYYIEPVSTPLQPTNDHSCDSVATLILSYPAAYKRQLDPINSRAWTFQELLLSTRAIIFSYRGIQLLDRTTIPEPTGLTSGRDPQLPNLPWSGKMFSLATSPENTRQVWLVVRGEYSRRNLSVQTDRLLAIAAMAEELGRTYGGRYLAGMWEADLAIDLQWKCPRDPGFSSVRRPRADGYVAPSWSWASAPSPVEDFVHVWEDEGDDGGHGVTDSLGFEIVSCEVELVVPGFAYGAVTGGTLIVKGQMGSYVWREINDEGHRDSQESDGFLTRFEDLAAISDEKVGEGSLDALDADLRDGTKVFCLATRSIENKRGRDDVEGLILLPTDNMRYRRVGFFRLHRRGELGSFYQGEFTIV